jgi:2-alkyl-3-oxoalkanoate reductase
MKESLMKVLVTGGGGFLGQAIIRRLIGAGDQVRSLQRSPSPELLALGVDCMRGDISQSDTVYRAAKDCDVVFHVAAKAGVWGCYNEFYQANVVGTENVIDACRAIGIGRLVYTSSPSVVFNGHDENGIDESVGYPPRYLTHYPQTKALAEQRVMAANDASLATVSLRPHLIWGPGDNHLVPRLIQRSQQGRLWRVGDGGNLVDTTYIDNAVEAHLLAAKHLAPGSAVAGRSYFISNGEPMPLWDMIDKLLACANQPPVRRRISATAAYVAGMAFECAYSALGLRDEPPMTRFVARQLATSHWFRLNAAQRDFGYVPQVTVEEGLRRLATALNNVPKPNEISKP